jgi:hypothetical protein
LRRATAANVSSSVMVSAMEDGRLGTLADMRLVGDARVAPSGPEFFLAAATTQRAKA